MEKKDEKKKEEKLEKLEGKFVGFHSFTREEIASYADLINFNHKDDEELKDLIPMNSENNDIFTASTDGRLFCKMVNKAVPGTIDPRAINKKLPLSVFHIKENLNLAINSAKSIGCVVVSIIPQLIMDKREHIILGFIHQLLRITFLGTINLKNHPYLIRLKKEGEELTDLLKLPPEELLLRWVNYHLKNANHKRMVTNFNVDLKDSENYTVLLNQLSPNHCDLSGLKDDIPNRSNKVIANAKKLGVPPFMRKENIMLGHTHLNTLFCAHLFNNCPGLTATEEEKFDAAKMLDDDVEGSREERAFRMWVNSLGIDGVYINNLYEDLKDGLALLKVMDKVEPGSVDWKKVEMKPTIKIKKMNNCGIAVELGKSPKFKFTLVGIGGIDIVDGNKKLTLALMWQLVRKHTLQLLGNKTEDDLLKWAQTRVSKEPNISSFKDSTISNCKFLFNLLSTIEPRAINWEIIKDSTTPEDIEMNAKYVLSVVRKLGGLIFCVWEDLKEVKPKMIMTLIAAIAKIAETMESNKK